MKETFFLEKSNEISAVLVAGLLFLLPFCNFSNFLLPDGIFTFEKNREKVFFWPLALSLVFSQPLLAYSVFFFLVPGIQNIPWKSFPEDESKKRWRNRARRGGERREAEAAAVAAAEAIKGRMGKKEKEKLSRLKNTQNELTKLKTLKQRSGNRPFKNGSDGQKFREKSFLIYQGIQIVLSIHSYNYYLFYVIIFPWKFNN